jgi:hypothetical protein
MRFIRKFIKKVAKGFMAAVHVHAAGPYVAACGRDAGATIGCIVAGPPGAVTGATIGAALGLLAAVGLVAVYTFSH